MFNIGASYLENYVKFLIMFAILPFEHNLVSLELLISFVIISGAELWIVKGVFAEYFIRGFVYLILL